MKKFIYFFSCRNLLNMRLMFELGRAVTDLDSEAFNRYHYVYLDKERVAHKRSGGFRLPLESGRKSRMRKVFDYNAERLELYFQPEGTSTNDICARGMGFYVATQIAASTLFVHYVSTSELNEAEILRLWEAINSKQRAEFMTAFSMDSERKAEQFMYGSLYVPKGKTPEECFTEEEIEQAYKINYWACGSTKPLGNAFPVCIVRDPNRLDSQFYDIQPIRDGEIWLAMRKQ